MDAIAQEASEPGLQAAPSQVWDVVQQWPILLLFLAGFAFAYWLFVVRKKDGEEPALAGNGHSDLRAFIGAKFEGLDGKVASVKEDIGELKADFKAHALQDRESFRELYDRSVPREAWSDDERRAKRAQR